MKKLILIMLLVFVGVIGCSGVSEPIDTVLVMYQIEGCDDIENLYCVYGKSLYNIEFIGVLYYTKSFIQPIGTSNYCALSSPDLSNYSNLTLTLYYNGIEADRVKPTNGSVIISVQGIAK
jgi:hypothetical protein